MRGKLYSFRSRELSGLRVSGFLPKPWMSEELAVAFQNLRCPMK